MPEAVEGMVAMAATGSISLRRWSSTAGRSRAAMEASAKSIMSLLTRDSWDGWNGSRSCEWHPDQRRHNQGRHWRVRRIWRCRRHRPDSRWWESEQPGGYYWRRARSWERWSFLSKSRRWGRCCRLRWHPDQHRHDQRLEHPQSTSYAAGADGIVISGGNVVNHGTINGGNAGGNIAHEGPRGGAGVALAAGSLINYDMISGGRGAGGRNYVGPGGAGVTISGGVLTNHGTIAGATDVAAAGPGALVSIFQPAA